MWKELKIPAVYTMEASFCGPDIGAHAGLHYTAENLMDIGRRLCLSLLIFCDVDIPKGIRELNAQGGKKRKPGATSSAQGRKDQEPAVILNENDICPELKQYTRKGLIALLTSDKTLLTAGSKNDSGDEGGGSDSDPSEDNMEEEEMAKIMPIKVSKKKQELPKKNQNLKKNFKSEESKEKQSQTGPKKVPKKPLNSGGSFFDRVRLPKSYGLRRVEMVDAWTQTSNRSNSQPPNASDKKEEGSKEQGTQALQLALSPRRDHSLPPMIHQPMNPESNNSDLTPARAPRGMNQGLLQYHQNHSLSVEKPLIQLESIRGTAEGEMDALLMQPQLIQSQINLATNQSHRGRPMVPGSHTKQQVGQPNLSVSPMKNSSLNPGQVKEREQALSIINQFINETSSSQSPLKPALGHAPHNTAASNPLADPYHVYNSGAAGKSPERRQLLQGLSQNGGHHHQLHKRQTSSQQRDLLASTNQSFAADSSHTGKDLNSSTLSTGVNQNLIMLRVGVLSDAPSPLKTTQLRHLTEQHKKQPVTQHNQSFNSGGGAPPDMLVGYMNTRSSLSGGGSSTYVRNQKKVAGVMLNSGGGAPQGQQPPQMLLIGGGQNQGAEIVNSRAAANGMEYYMRGVGGSQQQQVGSNNMFLSGTGKGGMQPTTSFTVGNRQSTVLPQLINNNEVPNKNSQQNVRKSNPIGILQNFQFQQKSHSFAEALRQAGSQSQVNAPAPVRSDTFFTQYQQNLGMPLSQSLAGQGIVVPQTANSLGSSSPSPMLELNLKRQLNKNDPAKQQAITIQQKIAAGTSNSSFIQKLITSKPREGTSTSEVDNYITEGQGVKKGTGGTMRTRKASNEITSRGINETSNQQHPQQSKMLTMIRPGISLQQTGNGTVLDQMLMSTKLPQGNAMMAPSQYISNSRVPNIQVAKNPKSNTTVKK